GADETEHPHRQIAAQRRVRRSHAAPMRREFPLELTALVADGAIHVVADAVQLARAACREAIPPLEPERETEIHQFEQVQVTRGVAPDMVQQLEEPLTAEGLPVEDVDHALARP